VFLEKKACPLRKKGTIGVRVITHENVSASRGVNRALAARSIRWPDEFRCRRHNLRQQRQRRPCRPVDLYPEVAAHVMRVTETAYWLEGQDWANPISQHPDEVKDGQLHIPDVPGVGLDWDEKAVAAHLADNF
jgi:hypothetical protein